MKFGTTCLSHRSTNADMYEVVGRLFSHSPPPPLFFLNRVNDGKIPMFIKFVEVIFHFKAAAENGFANKGQ